MEDEILSEYDRKIIGGTKRVSIPMENRALMRDTLDSLRRLTNDIQHALDMPGLNNRGFLQLCRGAVTTCNDTIRRKAEAHGVRIREGRPPDSERLGSKPLKIGKNSPHLMRVNNT